jgi:hypothetical protein
MYVCNYVCMYVCKFVCMYVCMYVCVCVYVCKFVLCMYVCVYMYVSLYVCMYVCMYVCAACFCHTMLTTNSYHCPHPLGPHYVLLLDKILKAICIYFGLRWLTAANTTTSVCGSESSGLS